MISRGFGNTLEKAGMYQHVDIDRGALIAVVAYGKTTDERVIGASIPQNVKHHP